MMRRMVIVAGNPYRHDDGVGPAVLDQLAEAVRGPDGPGDVELVEDTGEAAGLLNRWGGAGLVVLVDAVSSGAEPGTIHRFEWQGDDWAVPPQAEATSTHGLGLAQAVELGRALGSLPDRLVLFGVEAADTSHGTGLSPPVAAAVEPVVAQVITELGARWKQTPSEPREHAEGSPEVPADVS